MPSDGGSIPPTSTILRCRDFPGSHETPGKPGVFLCPLFVSVRGGRRGAGGRGVVVGSGQAAWEARAARPDPGGDRGVHSPQPAWRAGVLADAPSPGWRAHPGWQWPPSTVPVVARFCRPPKPGGRVGMFSLRLVDRGAGSTASVQVPGLRTGGGGLPRVCLGHGAPARFRPCRPRPRQGRAVMVPDMAGGRWAGWGSAQRFPVRFHVLAPRRATGAGRQCKQTLSRECPGIHIFQRSESRRLPRRMRGNHA